jgi:cytoplasmic iron level regulating protein YaaA (DUF328/UPF0246 family)
MLVILSPSKNLHNHPKKYSRSTLPRFHDETLALMKALQKQTPPSLQKLMDINEKLARVNVERYQQFTWPHSSSNATSAIFTFRGEVYQGFDANSLSEKEIEEANKRIRILSGLYGLLRPLDLIQPYRLEMGVELKIGKSKSLYDFWGDKITRLLNQDLAEIKSKEIVNLASQEYSMALMRDQLNATFTDIQFLEERNGKLQFLSFNAKRSRGWMARHIIEKKIKKVADLRGFNDHGYQFREDLSENQKLVFVR